MLPRCCKNCILSQYKHSSSTFCQASKALAVLQSLLQSPAGCGALAFPRSPMKADWKWQTCRSSPFDSVTQAPKTTLRRLEPKVPNLFKPQLCNSCTSEAEREMASESYLRTQPVTNDGAGYVLYCTVLLHVWSCEYVVTLYYIQ